MDGGALGSELRALRVLRGLTVIEAARRAGISRKSLQRWEAGDHAPRGAALASLLATLEASPQQRTSLLADAPTVLAQPALADSPLGPPAHPGAMLRALREVKGTTQAQLAGIVGVSQAAVAKWEAGQAMPGDETLVRALTALGAEGLDLREGSLDLYDPIVDPSDARARLRDPRFPLGLPHPPTVAYLLAIERELWPLAARDPRWEGPLAEALAFRSWSHVVAGEFTAAAEAAGRALRLAEAGHWNLVHSAFETLRAVRTQRGTEPARVVQFLVEGAGRARDPFVRGHLLLRATATMRTYDRREADRLFRRAEGLIGGAEPTEFTGNSLPNGPINVECLPFWQGMHAIALGDLPRLTEVYERWFAADWKRQLTEDGEWDVAEIVVGVHRLSGASPPAPVLEWLDAGARQAETYWGRTNFGRINAPLGLFVPDAAVVR